ncbi:MAG: histidine phosphatase family protein [Pseudomonadota bacterium]
MDLPPLAVLRHGETDWNVAGRMQGRLDSPLTPKGIEQARRQQMLAQGFLTSDWHIWSSPQPRALHTAAIVAAGSPCWVRTDDRLAEIDVDDWAGLRRSDIKARVDHTRQTPTTGLDYYDQTPGETFEQLRDRCFQFLQQLDRPTMIVTHGITSRMLRLVALDKETFEISHLPGGQGVIHWVKDGQAHVLSDGSA